AIVLIPARRPQDRFDWPTLNLCRVFPKSEKASKNRLKRMISHATANFHGITLIMREQDRPKTLPKVTFSHEQCMADFADAEAKESRTEELFAEHPITRLLYEGAATLPGGKKVPLIQISDWDFRWQNIYSLREPLHLPVGSKITMEARFDNSVANPRNPNNPPKTVYFGMRTKDDMCILYLFYTVDSEMLTKKIEAKGYPDTLVALEWDSDDVAKDSRK
ncbi:MAG: hypothetical protein ACR2MF_02255, partial [Chthoniobacterales bacterium]